VIEGGGFNHVLSAFFQGVDNLSDGVCRQPSHPYLSAVWNLPVSISPFASSTPVADYWIPPSIAAVRIRSTG
jgi:hypothetical protein